MIHIVELEGYFREVAADFDNIGSIEVSSAPQTIVVLDVPYFTPELFVLGLVDVGISVS